jgi:hypothetical protein
MSQLESEGAPANLSPAAAQPAAIVPSLHAPASGGIDCPTCGGSFGSMSAPSYVYAIGRIVPRFAQLSVEKEFAQATGRAETRDLTDREALHRVLSEPQNRYLARQLCWVMSVEGLETYILVPRDPVDLHLLVESLRPTPRPTDIDVVIGIKGPITPPTLCNGLMVPLILFDQIYSFDVDSLLGSLQRPEGVEAPRFREMAEEVFNRVTQIADNAGAADAHRALNYLVVRYPAIYARAAEQFGRDFSLTSVDVRPSALSGARKIVALFFHTRIAIPISPRGSLYAST